MERCLRMPLPELSRNQVLCSALWQLILRGLGLPSPRTEGQAPILFCMCVCVCVCDGLAEKMQHPFAVSEMRY